ncbi:MAG: sulfatase-like hydrolase/transferase [Bacteroidales bacterium]
MMSGVKGEQYDYREMIKDPRLEGQRPIPDETITLAELLRSAGYTTAAVGKWGLGAPGSEGDPVKQGFDLFFGYNCQRQAQGHTSRYTSEEQ